MNQLDRNSITEYLRQAMELERSVYAQKKAIETANTELNNNYPVVPVLNKPKQENVSYKKLEDENQGCLDFFAPFAPFIFAAINIWLGSAGWFFYVLAAGWVALGIKVLWSEKKEDIKKQEYNYQIRKEQERLNMEFEQAKLNYELQLKAANDKYQKDVALANDAKSEINKLDAPLNETISLLNKLYDKNILYAKYRTFAAVTTMYEYFVTGRCSELAGPDGAYNLYESELRQNLIINKLDDISNKLDQIKDNQYQLYQSIQEANQKIDIIGKATMQIMDNTAIIAAYSEIAAYCAEIAASNAAAQSAMMLFD